MIDVRNILLCISALPFMAAAQTTNGLDYVDPTIGGVSVLLQPTRPTVHLPNQVIRWTPTRADLTDEVISDYPLTMLSHRRESAFGFMPFAGAFDKQMFSKGQVYDHEVNKPYVYTAQLEGCNLAFTPSRKSGIVKMDFTSDEEHWMRFRTLGRTGTYRLDGRTVAGETEFEGVKVYLYAVFDKDVNGARYDGGNRHMIISAGKSRQSLLMRYAISYISLAQAKENLQNEIPIFDFDRMEQQAQQIWQLAISQIEVRGGTERHKRMFYTAFYRCMERMVDINEYGRYYSGFDHKVHSSQDAFFTDNWIWDLYVAEEPLWTILNPEQETLKLNSYIEMYKQSGTMPSFAILSGDWPAMTGNYAAVWFADSWAKGLCFDLKTAFEGCKHNSLHETLIPWRNGERTAIDRFYDTHGYFPSLHPGEKETISRVDPNWERRQAVSITTAFSYCDWAVAQMAHELGLKDDEALFNKRSLFYRNVYRPDKSMFWPKDSAGNWIEGIDPRYMDRAYFTENNAYTFQWDVKHNLEDLFCMMGGKDKALQQLDNLFRTPIGMSKFKFYSILPDATGMIGQFAMGNEPSFHIPYLFNYLGAPWKTQKWIHTIIDSQFNDTWTGMPGDEDGGGMSAFLVFSMMGFFPVSPGIPTYAIGSPFFEDTVINLPNGKKFSIHAENFSEENKYIKSITLNGKKLDSPFITHDDIMNGGTLHLVMDNKYK